MGTCVGRCLGISDKKSLCWILRVSSVEEDKTIFIDCVNNVITRHSPIIYSAPDNFFINILCRIQTDFPITYIPPSPEDAEYQAETGDNRRKYLRTRYSVEKDISIEFENLMDDGRLALHESSDLLTHSQDNNVDEMSRLVTDHEKHILASKQYTDLVHEQKKLDHEIDRKLAQQEEELRLEEEKFYEAKREAARTAKLQRAKELQAKSRNSSKNKSWLGDNENEWEVAGGEDDFEMFLASVKARSFKSTAHLRQGSGDGQSSNSSGTTQTRERSQTEGSSLDLEWEHEEGMSLQKKPRSATEENLVTAFVHKPHDSPVNSNDLEWDNDFVSAEMTSDTEQLLAAEKKIQEFSSR